MEATGQPDSLVVIEVSFRKAMLGERYKRNLLDFPVLNCRLLEELSKLPTPPAAFEIKTDCLSLLSNRVCAVVRKGLCGELCLSGRACLSCFNMTVLC